MLDFLAAVGILHRKVEGLLIDTLRIDAPTLRRVGKSFLQLHELGKVVVVERVGLAEVAARVELVEPDFARACAFLEEQHDSLHACALEGAARKIEDTMQVAAFQQQLAQTHRGIVAVREKGILDYDTAATARLDDLDEVLEEQERSLSSPNR